MKPRNRQTLYCVVRTELRDYYVNPLLEGCFKTFEAADNYKDSLLQAYIDKGYNKDQYRYTVEASIYYDE